MIGRIRERRLFEELRHSGRRLRRGPLTVTYIEVAPDVPGPLLGFAIGRRFGSAVIRNRARRRVREAFRLAAARHGTLPYALLVQARPTVLDRPFETLVDDAHHLLAGLQRAAPPGDTDAVAPGPS